jgi:hypothetical protein
VSARESSVYFESESVQGDMKRLLDWAQAEHVELDNLQAVRPSLDDVFVKLAAETTSDIAEVGS